MAFGYIIIREPVAFLVSLIRLLNFLVRLLYILNFVDSIKRTKKFWVDRHVRSDRFVIIILYIRQLCISSPRLGQLGLEILFSETENALNILRTRFFFLHVAASRLHDPAFSVRISLPITNLRRLCFP